MVTFPILFLKHFEEKYSVHLLGKKSFSLIRPQVKINQASFVWNDKIALEKGNFEIGVDPWVWLQTRVWSVRVRGDGAKLRFLGEWLRKTGVSEVTATRLRLAISFSNEGIQDIDTVDLVAANYQLQIHSRLEKRGQKNQ